MADPGTILAIISGLVQTAEVCYDVIKNIHHAPDEIKSINSEVANWRPQLESLGELLEGNSQSAKRLRRDIENGVLLEVKALISELNRILEPYRRPSHWQRFKWGITIKDHVRDLLNQLERDMGVILGNLQVETNLSLVGMQKEIRQIQLCEASEYEKRNILQWLRPQGIDAHEFHRQKRALREEGTCDWLAQSVSWLDWCQGGTEQNARFLWIHGLPGAGKTVLASFAIDHVASLYHHRGVSYYYCSHERQKRGHTSSEEACSFLRWVIRDLTAQVNRLSTGAPGQQATIPQKLGDLYKTHDFSVQSLLECLLAVTEHMVKEFQQQVCIIVDAVDESPSPRDTMLSVLTIIGTNPEWQHVSLCFTSRNEADIFRAIKAIQPAKAPTIQPPKAPASPVSRKIRIATGPGGSTVGGDVQYGAGHVIKSGFDGGSSFRNDMPPPPWGANALERGRTPSGGPIELSNATYRISRSQIRVPSGDIASHQIGRVRAASVRPGDDPMDIDSDNRPLPRAAREGCTELSLDDNPDVRDAIRTFVRSQLKDNGCKGEVLGEVVDMIAKRAKGMFRWAACQVDIIVRSNVYDTSSISDMLEKIPPDIFGTYEHMITRLLPDGQGQTAHNRNFARTALALICSPSSDIPCATVLVQASRFHVPSGTAHLFSLAHLEKILGCLITVTPLNKGPESLYGRTPAEIDVDAKKNVSVAHYTVKEYLFDKSTALGKVKDFALSMEAIQNLELQVFFLGLQQFSRRSGRGTKSPTLYEEYCLKMTDRALKERRSLILGDQTVWKAVTECLRWDCEFHLQTGTFPNPKIRAELSSWMKTTPFERGKEPKMSETSILVSLVLLEWPELAKVYLADLPEDTKREVWKDKFEIGKRPRAEGGQFKVEGTNPITLIQLCVTRRDVAFLEVLVESKANFSDERDLVMDLFYHAYGHETLRDQDGGAKTSKMLKMLLERGVRAEAPGYVFTPLQFAVKNLEDRWVRDLLFEGADPNKTGNPKGVHPFGDDQDDIQGHLTPLEICRKTAPKWLKPDKDAKEVKQEEDEDTMMGHARRMVMESLIQFGAEDIQVTEDAVVVVDSD